MANLINKIWHQMPKPGFPESLCLLALMLAAVSIYEGATLTRLFSINRMIESGVSNHDDDNEDAHVTLTNAWQLQTKGDHQKALQIYNSIDAGSDSEILENAKYNSGVIFLENAAEKWNELGVFAFAEVDTLVNLAEENFRDVLRLNPNNQNARYNLEYTLRIRPPRKEVEKSDWDGRKSSVFSILPGIPKGGP